MNYISVKRPTLCLLFLSVLALLLSSCGGGTTGSDGGVVAKISGFIIDTNGAAVVGATIRDDLSGLETQTNQDGRFDLTLTPDSDSVTLTVNSQNDSYETEIPVLEDSNSLVLVTIQIDTALEELNIVSLDVQNSDSEELEPETPNLDPTPGVPAPQGQTRITGRLRFAGGPPLRDVAVQIRVQNDKGPVSKYSQISTNKGIFTFDIPSPFFGLVELTVTGPKNKKLTVKFFNHYSVPLIIDVLAQWYTQSSSDPSKPELKISTIKFTRRSDYPTL